MIFSLEETKIYKKMVTMPKLSINSMLKDYKNYLKITMEAKSFMEEPSKKISDSSVQQSSKNPKKIVS